MQDDFQLGFTSGVWDLLHPGHASFLISAMRDCEQLVVGLQANPTLDRTWKNKPVQSLYERYMALDCFLSHRAFDGKIRKNIIVPYEREADLIEIIAHFQPDARFLGADYLNKPESITGYDLCTKLNTTFVYLPRDHSLSTSELRQRIAVAESYKK